MRLVRHTEVALRVLRRQIHRAHQVLDLLAVHLMPLVLQPVADAPVPLGWQRSINAISSSTSSETGLGTW